MYQVPYLWVWSNFDRLCWQNFDIICHYEHNLHQFSKKSTASIVYAFAGLVLKHKLSFIDHSTIFDDTRATYSSARGNFGLSPLRQAVSSALFKHVL